LRFIARATTQCVQVESAARNHQRYMHYFERYKGHMDSFYKEVDKR
jgi:ariadne-1